MKAFLKAHPEGTLLSVKAHPRASKNEIGEAHGNELKIKVTAPPVDYAANGALVELLAEALDCSKSAIVLARGASSRHKLFLLRGLKVDEVEKRLGF